MSWCFVKWLWSRSIHFTLLAFCRLTANDVSGYYKHHYFLFGQSASSCPYKWFFYLSACVRSLAYKEVWRLDVSRLRFAKPPWGDFFFFIVYLQWWIITEWLWIFLKTRSPNGRSLEKKWVPPFNILGDERPFLNEITFDRTKKTPCICRPRRPFLMIPAKMSYRHLVTMDTLLHEDHLSYLELDW